MVRRAGGDDEEFQFWWDRLARVTGQYTRVLMLGDSMGATAALMFSPLATSVHAFAPQVCPCLFSCFSLLFELLLKGSRCHESTQFVTSTSR